MNIGAISFAQSYAAANAAPKQRLDNEGDYDKGTGKDDAVKKQALQASAQPHLGSNVNLTV